MSDIILEDMAYLCRQGIDIDDDNYQSQENVPRQADTTSGTGNWRRESIIRPWKSGNFQNYFASFRHYFHGAVLHMSLLQFF